MIKILHLLSSSVYSGAENVACQIISMFQSYSNIEMVYCSPEGQISSSLNDRNVKFMPLARFDFTNIRKVVNDYKPDIIHAHDVTASVYAAMLSSKCKVISHMHVNNSNMSKLCLKSIVYRLSSFCYSHIFWVSNSAFNCYIYKDKLKFKSSILYNIIDKDDLLAKIDLDSNTYNYDIVYVGRITYQKHPERLINLIKKIKSLYPNLKVAIVGSGDLLEVVKNMVFDYNLVDTIDFLGFMKNPTKILKSSKLMIMTSRFEGTPMVALEAMCLGTPIISTPTDGMIDLIDNGVNGYLSDNDDDLLSSCISIIKNNALRNKLSEASIIKYNQYCDIRSYTNTLYNKYVDSVTL